ncbi:MAG: GxxExxY protein [Planctomycetaceae bacterium]|jgi:GxxExxY protein|nr:GxxExxY protein [Planctomycetaceae bacterium]
MKESDKPFAKEGYQLMGAAFEVHNILGGGLTEEIYQQSLEIELQLQKIPFVPKQELRVFYKNYELHKRYIPDLVVYEGIVVELKAQSKLIAEHEGQIMNYMRISRSPIGYLINFGPMGKLDYKRFILSDLIALESQR